MKIGENTYVYGVRAEEKDYLVYLSKTESIISSVLSDSTRRAILVEYAEMAFKSRDMVVAVTYGTSVNKYALCYVTNDFSRAVKAAHEDGVLQIIDLRDMSIIPAVEGDEE